MRALALILLLPALAFAQPTVTRGGALKKRQYQTYSNMTLYVDPTGSDSGACTSSGTGACATIQGAVNKLPPVIRHNVVINVAAGTYGAFVLNGFDINGGVSITLQGSTTWTNWTPGSGAATGTVTSYDAGVFPGKVTVTDSTQTWPTLWSTNDYLSMRGRYLYVQTGADAGQYRAISESNGTTLSLAGPYSTPVPAAGMAYAVQEPSTIVSGTGVLASLGRVNGQVTINDFKFLQGDFNASISTVNSRPATNLRLTLQRVMLDGSAAGAGPLINLNSPTAIASFSDVSLNGGNNSNALIRAVGQGATLSRSYTRGQRSQLDIETPQTTISYGQFDAWNITTTAVVLSARGRIFMFNAFFVCTPRASTGAYYGGVPAIVLDPGTYAYGGFSSDGCGAGMRLVGATYVGTSSAVEIKNSNASSYLSTDYGGFNLQSGGSLDLRVTPLYMSNNGPDAGVDYMLGPDQFSDAFLSSLPDGGAFVGNIHGMVWRR